MTLPRLMALYVFWNSVWFAVAGRLILLWAFTRDQFARRLIVVGDAGAIAAENLDRPRLDLLASAQTNGFGNDLLGPRSAPGTTLPLGNAYDRLLRFNQTGWNLGVEYSQPLGLRFANQQVKNNELKLIKAMTILEAQEADILHQMTAAFQTNRASTMPMSISWVRVPNKSQPRPNGSDIKVMSA